MILLRDAIVAFDFGGHIGIDRCAVLRERHGLGLCNIVRCCTEICPADIKITDNAIIPMKERAVDQRYGPLRCCCAPGTARKERRAAAMRIDYREEFPAGVRAMAELERAVLGSTLEPGLLELVRVRASQVNGCTYCLAMHNRDARSRGEHQTRLDTLAAWREAPYYTGRERAALAWCEALTELPRTGAPDDAYATLEAVFSPAEIAALTFAIVAINGWNRLAVGLRSDVMSLDGLDLPAGANAPAGGSGSA